MTRNEEMGFEAFEEKSIKWCNKVKTVFAEESDDTFEFKAGGALRAVIHLVIEDVNTVEDREEAIEMLSAYKDTIDTIIMTFRAQNGTHI